MDSPYFVGNVLRLRQTNSQIELSVRIEHMYEPFTFSVVLRLSVLDVPFNRSDMVAPGDIVVVKLFDRRFSSGMRNRQGHAAVLYDNDVDQSYKYSLLMLPPTNGQTDMNNMSGPNTNLRPAPKDISHDVRAEAAAERKLQEDCLSLFKAEVSVYERLWKLQGDEVPRCLGSVELVHDQESQALIAHMNLGDKDKGRILKYLSVPGVLLSYVEGRPLREMSEFVPRDKWKAVIVEACEIINKIGDQDVLNDDVTLDDILAWTVANQSVPGTIEYKPVALDFAHARLRREDEDKDAWREAKYRADEEGSIGFNMFSVLKLPRWDGGPGTLSYTGLWSYEDRVLPCDWEERLREKFDQHQAMIDEPVRIDGESIGDHDDDDVAMPSDAKDDGRDEKVLVQKSPEQKLGSD